MLSCDTCVHLYRALARMLQWSYLFECLLGPGIISQAIFVLGDPAVLSLNLLFKFLTFEANFRVLVSTVTLWGLVITSGSVTVRGSLVWTAYEQWIFFCKHIDQKKRKHWLALCWIILMTGTSHGTGWVTVASKCLTACCSCRSLKLWPDRVTSKHSWMLGNRKHTLWSICFSV